MSKAGWRRRPGGRFVHELVEEARQIIAQRLRGLVQPA
jgi:hypothetical protein